MSKIKDSIIQSEPKWSDVKIQELLNEVDTDKTDILEVTHHYLYDSESNLLLTIEDYQDYAYIHDAEGTDITRLLSSDDIDKIDSLIGLKGVDF